MPETDDRVLVAFRDYGVVLDDAAASRATGGEYLARPVPRTPRRPRWQLVVAGVTIAVLAVVVAVIAGGTGSSPGPTSDTTLTVPVRQSNFEVRPVVAISPSLPEGVQAGVPGVEKVVGEGSVRYAVGSVLMSNEVIAEARAEHNPGMGWVVNLSLTPAGVATLQQYAQTALTLPPPQDSIALLVDNDLEGVAAFDESAGDFSSLMLNGIGTMTEDEAKGIAAALHPAVSAPGTPTRGTMPTPRADGSIDGATIPDFISTVDRSGKIVGFVKREDMLDPSGDSPRQTVYGDDLETVVGHMYPGRGFVPIGQGAATVPLAPSSTTVTTAAN